MKEPEEEHIRTYSHRTVRDGSKGSKDENANNTKRERCKVIGPTWNVDDFLVHVEKGSFGRFTTF